MMDYAPMEIDIPDIHHEASADSLTCGGFSVFVTDNAVSKR